MTLIVLLAEVLLMGVFMWLTGWLALGAIAKTGNRVRLPSGIASLFACLTIGLVAVVVYFSFARTGGRTSNLALLLPCAAALLAWPRDHAIRAMKLPSVKEVCFLISSLLLAALWLAPRTLSYVGLERTPLPRDDVFYATVVETLRDRGLETTEPLAALLGEPQVRPNIYHYFELWLGAFASQVFGVPPSLGLRFHADAVMLATVMIGFAALFSDSGHRGLGASVAAILLAFANLELLPSPDPSGLLREVGNWQTALAVGGPTKLLPGYVFGLVAALTLGRVGTASLACAAMAVATCASVSLGPLLAGTLASTLVNAKRLKLSAVDAASILLSALGPLAFVAYFQLGGGSPSSMAGSALPPLNMTAATTMAHILVKSLGYCALFFGPPIIVALRTKSGERGQGHSLRFASAAMASTVALVTGLSIWVILHRWYDASQFFLNSVAVGGIILCAAVFCSSPSGALRQGAALVTSVIGIINLVVLAYTWSQGSAHTGSYLAELKRLGRFNPPVGGYLISIEAARSRPYWSLNPMIMSPSSLSAVDCCSGAIALADLSPAAQGDAQLQGLWRTSAFSRFAHRQGLNLSRTEDLDEAQRRFVTERGLRFVVVAERTPIPPWLKLLTIRKISSPEETFLLIDPKRISPDDPDHN